tara:strand:+ start:4260 stop:4373 length:114 start_codon:yes stop_codon:yes gene_type:complete
VQNVVREGERGREREREGETVGILKIEIISLTMLGNR